MVWWMCRGLLLCKPSLSLSLSAAISGSVDTMTERWVGGLVAWNLLDS